MKIFYSSIISLFISINIFSQVAPGIQWQQTIGGNSTDILYSIKQTFDGGYILAGYSASGMSGDKTEANRGIIGTFDYWVIKLNAAGNIQWQKTIGGNGDEQLYEIEQTSNAGYIIAGYSTSGISGEKTQANIGQYDYWVVKLDSTGNILWQNNIGSNGMDALTSVDQTSDGGYIIGGLSDGGISGSKTEPCFGDVDYWVLKLDAEGNIEWQNTIGGNKEDYLFVAEQTSDGGYILGGSSKSDISGDKTEAVIGIGDYWIVKLNPAGNIEWQSTIGSNAKDALHAIHQTSDGGYITAGYSMGKAVGDKTEKSKFNDYWIVKLNDSGNIIWQNTITASDTDLLFSLEQTFDGGYILAGYSNSPINDDKTEACFGSYDYWLVKIDSLGNILWDKTMGGSGDDQLYSVKPASDHGYILAGYSASGISGTKTEDTIGGYDYWIIKLYPENSCQTAPAGLFADNITSTKVRLHWNTDPFAIKYNLQYSQAASPTWINLNSPTNGKTITGLVPNTLYKYRVRSQCSAALSSPWSAVATFTTLPLKEGMNGEWSMVNIYPNPARDKINIESNHHSPLTIHIYNITGQLIKSETVNSDRTTIHVQSISAGIYLFELIADGMEAQMQKVNIE